MMKRITGLRALGAALMLTTLTAAGVLVTPGVGGATSTSSATFGTLPSPCGKGVLALCRGIEVGHVFQLRQKYSEPMGCSFLDRDGKLKVMEMGCYGIGVSRIVGAAIEQSFDDRGIIFSDCMAPFTVVIVPMGYGRSEMVRVAADRLHEELLALGIDVLLDDRDERPGVLLADSELLGIPHRVVIGERGLKEGNVEYQARRDSSASSIAFGGIVQYLQARLAS